MINPHLNILVQLAKVDGQADHTELEIIRAIGKSKNLSDEDIENAIDLAEEGDLVDSVSEFSPIEKLDLLLNLVLVMKADGIVHKEEMKFCLKLVRKLGYDDDALFDLVSHTKVDDELTADRSQMEARANKHLLK